MNGIGGYLFVCQLYDYTGTMKNTQNASYSLLLPWLLASLKVRKNSLGACRFICRPSIVNDLTNPAE
jgi:hypothetical protein